MTYPVRQSQPHHAPLMSVNKSESTAANSPFPFFQVLRYFKAYCYEHPEVNAQHRSLFYYLLEVVEHRRKLSRFQLNRTDGMDGSGIGSKNTYLAALKQLQSWGLIDYTPGKNGERAAIIEVLPNPSTVPELGQWAGQWWDSARDADCDAGGTTKKTLNLETLDSESEKLLALAQKKIAELEAELAAVKAQASASHTRGGGAGAPLAIEDDPYGAQPRDAAMVDEFLAQHHDPKVRQHAGKGHLFIAEYGGKGWVYGKFHTPIRSWRSLIPAFQFREPPQAPGGPSNPIQARLAVAQESLAMNSYDEHGNRLN